MKLRYILTVLLTAASMGCSNFLEEEPDNVIPEDAVFGDEAAMNQYWPITTEDLTTPGGDSV